MNVGSIVTTSGIVTTGSEWGQIRYIQDINAGIALFSNTLSSLRPGDSIVVTGVVSKYREQIELSPVHSFQIFKSGVNLPPAKIIERFSHSTEELESMRVIISCCGMATCDPVFEDDEYSLFDINGEKSKIKFNADDLLVGLPVLTSASTATGIWRKQDDEFILLADSLYDAVNQNCVVIYPGQVVYFNDLLHLSWYLDHNNYPTWIEYGEDDFTTIEAATVINHQVTKKPQNVDPGKIYKGRIGQRILGDTVYSPETFFTAISNSTPIEVFFNRPVNTSFSDGSFASGVSSSIIETDLIDRIDDVTSTLEIAMYNSSRTTITDAVKRAVQRGVNVRYIAEEETGNSALQGSLPFPVHFRTGDGIMHNKFVIGDVDDPLRSWVWTGSTNFSSNQITSDPNHAVVYHDHSLAKNFRKEFDEMWGALPGQQETSTGDSKEDNTVHTFRIGERVVESYFSPSDETNCHIIRALESTDFHVEIGLLLLTDEKMTDAIIHLNDAGIGVRVILEDEESSAEAIFRLKQNGVDVVTHDLAPIFHHKYAIIDEGYTDSDPIVISGSHNWTYSADHINDENTMIIHDQSVANIFRQEFEARWSELMETEVKPVLDSIQIIVQPNPAINFIELNNPLQSNCVLSLHDVWGKIVEEITLDANETLQHPVYQLPEGTYTLSWKWKTAVAVSRFIVQR